MIDPISPKTDMMVRRIPSTQNENAVSSSMIVKPFFYKEK